MYKKISVVLIFVILLFSLFGCNRLGVGKALILKEKDHIKFNYLDDKRDRIEYQGNIYYLSPIYLYDNMSGDCLELGWIGSRFGYHYSVYCDSIDNPTFLYVNDGYTCYIKETFKYEAEVFKVENTPETIVFDEDLLQCDEVADFFGKTQNEIIISSITCPKLKINLFIFEENGEWYAASRNRIKYKISVRFLDILNEYQILNSDKN